MDFARPLILLLLAGLALAPTASAHLTVTATAPSGTIPHDAPTNIPVQFSASCATVLTEYEAESKSPLTVVLNPGAPTWVTGVGTSVPFKVDQCGTDGNVKASGTLTITPGPFAPGLQEVKIPVGAKNAKGDAEVGEALVPIRIAYRGALNITGTFAPHVRLDNGTGTANLLFNASLNADSMAMIEVVTPPQHGQLDLLTSVDIASALAENQTYRLVPFQIGYRGGADANFTMDTAVLRIMMHAQSDPGAATEAQEITLHFMPADAGIHDEAHLHEESRGIPALNLITLAAAGIGALMVARRRR